jgi:hypothetical protein
MNAILKDIVCRQFGIDLVCCTQVMLNEIEQGLTLGDVAQTYALSIRSEANGADKPDWPTINAAIIARFGQRGLDQVKKIAWRRLETRGNEARS